MIFKVNDIVLRTGPSIQHAEQGGEYIVSEVFPEHIRLKGHGAFKYKAGRFQLVCQSIGDDAKPNAGQSARKDDGGKLDFTLLDDMPNALEAVVEVMQWAITKKAPKPYARGSWQGVDPDRYRAAIGRHDNGACKQAVSNGEPVRYQRDDETQLLHLAHIATSALFALESTIRELKGKK